MISILTRPYSIPVVQFATNASNNSMPFVVMSNFKNRPNFRYLANIYKGPNLVAKLKHNPDVVSKYGIFDVSRVLANVLAHDNDIPTTLAQWSYSPKESATYSIRFGEQYSRYGVVSGWSAGAAPYAAYYKLLMPQGHNLRLGDHFQFQMNEQDNAQYTEMNNKTFEVIAVDTTGVTINKMRTQTFQFTGTFIEGETAVKIRRWTDASGTQKIAYLFSKTRPTRFRVGDTIAMPYPTQPLNQISGLTKVVAIEDKIESGVSYDFIKTDLTLPPNWTDPIGSNFAIINYSDYFLEDQVSTTDVQSWIINAALQYKEFKTWNWERDYVIGMPSGVPAKKWLTRQPSNTAKVRFTDYHTLSFLKRNWRTVSQTNYVTGLEVSVTTNLGTTTFTRSFPNTVQDISKFGSQMRLNVQVGPAYLSTVSGWPAFGTVSKYTVKLKNGSTTVSETYTFEIDTTCQEWNTYRFVWLNRLGAWDYFEYKGKPLETTDIARLEYNRRLESLDSSNNWTYQLGDRGDSTYGVTATESVKTWSGYITRNTANWLQELYTSPAVYIIEGTTLIPVNILDETWTKPQVNKAGLINLPIDFKYSFSLNIQKGGEPVDAAFPLKSLYE